MVGNRRLTFDQKSLCLVFFFWGYDWPNYLLLFLKTWCFGLSKVPQTRNCFVRTISDSRCWVWAYRRGTRTLPSSTLAYYGHVVWQAWSVRWGDSNHLLFSLPTPGLSVWFANWRNTGSSSTSAVETNYQCCWLLKVWALLANCKVGPVPSKRTCQCWHYLPSDQDKPFMIPSTSIFVLL